MRVCHITTVHFYMDTRILHRECVSLAQKGWEVHLIVANQQSVEFKGVKIHNVESAAEGRLQRMWQTANLALKKALEIDAAIYHIHDPELLRIAGKLRRMGKKVIYDSHEHVPHQIRNKKYLPAWLRPVIATVFEWYENRMARRMSAIVTATDNVRDRFRKLNARTVDINNYPRFDVLYVEEDWSKKWRDVVYVGLINEIRGIREMLDALALPGDPSWTLTLVGYFERESQEDAMKQHPGWKKVRFMGRQAREQVAESLATSKIGIVTFLSAPNHDDNQPNKLFEYMAAGIPVVCSHFERWKKIVETAHCGICVDPSSPQAIAEAVRWLLTHQEEARAMGLNGRRAMENQYNWNTEEAKLHQLYLDLAGL